eukprot:729361-Pyramimonas_sp.AAC.1
MKVRVGMVGSNAQGRLEEIKQELARTQNMPCKRRVTTARCAGAGWHIRETGEGQNKDIMSQRGLGGARGSGLLSWARAPMAGAWQPSRWTWRGIRRCATR